MPLFRKITAVTLLATFAAALVAGCGLAPTAPVITNPATTSQANTSQATTSEAAAVHNGQSLQSSSLLGGVLGIVGGLVKLIFRVLYLVGNIGGSLSNGRWRVDVPAGAVAGDATISLGVAGSTSPSCQLQISPIELNHFSVPAQLTVSCPGVSDDQLRDYVIALYNPQMNRWTPVAGSTVNLTNRTVSAPLQHFSTYSVGPREGRASW